MFNREWISLQTRYDGTPVVCKVLNTTTLDITVQTTGLAQFDVRVEDIHSITRLSDDDIQQAQVELDMNKAGNELSKLATQCVKVFDRILATLPDDYANLMEQLQEQVFTLKESQ